MLQISTGVYFRDVPLNETTHRAVLYTNAWAVSREPLQLPVGLFRFSTSPSPVAAVTIEVIERLEAIGLDGTDEIMIATAGGDIIDDAADVFAFALNVSCSRNAALMQRFVPADLRAGPRRGPSSILRRTFDPTVVLQPEELEAASVLVSRLLALRRDFFEAAMRSIRSIVDATLLVADDPGLAYTLFVASLESLAQLAIPAQALHGWDTYDGKRRKVVDAAVESANLSEAQAAAIRLAVMEIDQLSLRRRFIDFTLAHVNPDYYRDDARSAVRPIRANDLPNALDVAYQIRSRNVHALEALAPELWAIADRADTLRWEGRSALSLEGLSRLCRQVVKSFIEQGPSEVDESFRYRDHLPGIVRVQLAPQYWVGSVSGFEVDRAPQVLEGLIDLLVETIRKPDEPQVPDLTEILSKIETLLPNIGQVEKRAPLVAIYTLWHAFMNPSLHRPQSEELVERFGDDLTGPSMVGFALRVLLERNIEWDLDQQIDLVARRRSDLLKGRGQPLAPRFDAALLVSTSAKLCAADRLEEAEAYMAEAVEALPGNELLMDIESAASRGEEPTISLLDLVVG